MCIYILYVYMYVYTYMYIFTYTITFWRFFQGYKPLISSAVPWTGPENLILPWQGDETALLIESQRSFCFGVLEVSASHISEGFVLAKLSRRDRGFDGFAAKIKGFHPCRWTEADQ